MRRSQSRACRIRRDTCEEIVFCEFKDHVYRFVFENNLFERHDILMVNLTIELERRSLAMSFAIGGKCASKVPQFHV
jgi:hypothetical protein